MELPDPPPDSSSRSWLKVATWAAWVLGPMLFVLMRIPLAAVDHAAKKATCLELYLQPQDWTCSVSLSWTRWAYGFAALATYAAFALPPAILAKTGRKWTFALPVLIPLALFPMVLFLWADDPNQDIVSVLLFGEVGGGSWWTAAWGTAAQADGSIWTLHPIIASGVSIALMLLPSAFMAARATKLQRRRPYVLSIAGFLSIVLCALIWSLIQGFGNLLGGIDPLVGVFDWFYQPWAPLQVMALFGLFLGTHRFWWPWVLVPAAILLSFAIPYLLIGNGWDPIPEWSLFLRSALPLATAGFVASLSEPISRVLGRRLRFGRDLDWIDERQPKQQRTSRLRGRTVLNATAAGVLIATTIAGSLGLEIVGISVSSSLPTYLGARDRASSYQGKHILLLASDALSRYYSASGSFQGFDAEDGERLQDQLAWQDGLPGTAGTRPLVVHLHKISPDLAEVVLVGNSVLFCGQTDGAGRSTYAESYGSRLHPSEIAFRVAVRECADTPLSVDSLRALDPAVVCPETEVVLTDPTCREIQHLIREKLTQTQPPEPPG